MPLIDKLWKHLIPLIMKVILLSLAIATFFLGEYVWMIGTLLALFLTLVPTILSRDFNVRLPLIFDVSITVAIFLHWFGGYSNWYDAIPFYDHFTHFISSCVVSLIGITLLFILQFHLKMVNLPPIGFGIFTVIFALAMGVIWEFMEFGGDLLFDLRLQRGLHDTMMDFVFDALAGVFIAVIATTQLEKKKHIHIRDDLIIGDIKKSSGYKKWRDLAHSNAKVHMKIKMAFKDPIILENIFDYIVRESNHITKEEEDIWHEAKGQRDRRAK